MKWLRSVAFALFLALVVGFAIGTALRLRVERSVYYVGSATATQPFDIGDARASVLDPRHHEEQIGKAI